MVKRLTGKTGLKKNVIKKEVFDREIALCKMLSQKHKGKCSWGRCKACGVTPLLWKLHKGQLLEDSVKIRRIKKKLIKI